MPHQIVFVSPDGTREVVIADGCSEAIMRELVDEWNYATELLGDGVYEFVKGDDN